MPTFGPSSPRSNREYSRNSCNPPYAEEWVTGPVTYQLQRSSRHICRDRWSVACTDFSSRTRFPTCGHWPEGLQVDWGHGLMYPATQLHESLPMISPCSLSKPSVGSVLSSNSVIRGGYPRQLMRAEWPWVWISTSLQRTMREPFPAGRNLGTLIGSLYSAHGWTSYRCADTTGLLLAKNVVGGAEKG